VNRLEWTELLLKVFALTNALSSAIAVPYLVGTVATLSGIPEANVAVPWPTVAAIAVLVIIFPLVASILIWWQARPIANRIWSSPADADAPSGIGPTSFEIIQMAIFTTIGLFFLVSGIPDLLSSIVNLVYFQAFTNFTGSGPVELFYPAIVFGNVLQLVIALGLIFGRRRLASAGGKPPNAEGN